MENELRLMLSWFEEKVDKAERNYMEKHKGDFNIKKMKSSVNRKLKREREFFIKVNLMPSDQILSSGERFKY